MWRNRAAFRPTFLELLDEADVDARVVLVDAWTSVGGSQFVDSSGSGRYHTYLCEDVVPFVDARYETNGLRGVAGKSSGGYGAAVTAMLRPDLFSGFASHAGGGLFGGLDPPVLLRVAARRLRDAYDGSVERLLDEPTRGTAPLAHPDDLHVLLQWGFASAYSADDDGTVRLPYDVATAEVVPELRARWPRVGLPGARPPARGLRSLRAIYVDCGRRDEWYLDLTAEWLRRRLTDLRVPDLHVELIDAMHQAIGTATRSASATSPTGSTLKRMFRTSPSWTT